MPPKPWTRDPTWQRLVAADKAESSGPIFTFQSTHDPWLTNSYYFATERGSILFDTQTCRGDAEALWADMQRNTPGPLRAIVITHGHPDHFLGNTFFRERAPSTPIIASVGVATEMWETAALRAATLSHEFGPDQVPPDFPDSAQPDLVFDGSMTVRLDDGPLELTEYGPSEARAHVVGWISSLRALICGDIVQNRQHYWLGEQEFPAWYQQLAALECYDPVTVHTGHQGVAGPEIFGESKRWIATYLGLMASEVGPFGDPQALSRLDDDAARRVMHGMLDAFPDWYDEIMTSDGETAMEFCFNGRDTATEPPAVRKARELGPRDRR